MTRQDGSDVSLARRVGRHDDPLHVACEGRFAAFIAAQDAERALPIMRAHDVGAAIIGQAVESSAPLVTLKSAIGASRILDMPSGEQLPRIC